MEIYNFAKYFQIEHFCTGLQISSEPTKISCVSGDAFILPMASKRPEPFYDFRIEKGKLISVDFVGNTCTKPNIT